MKYSFERTWDPNVKTRVSTVFTTVERVEAPDPMTVVFTTKKPDPLLAARSAFYGGQIVPKKYVEVSGGDAFNAKPIGTGPVRFVSWTKDDRIVLEANPDYRSLSFPSTTNPALSSLVSAMKGRKLPAIGRVTPCPLPPGTPPQPLAP